MPDGYLKTEALRVRQMYRFKTPNGTEYENHVKRHYGDELIEDLSEKNIKCEDLGMRKGQIWRSLKGYKDPSCPDEKYEYHKVTNFDEDNWVYWQPYDIEKREIVAAYQSQSMERQSSYIRRKDKECELFEGELFKENK